MSRHLWREALHAAAIVATGVGVVVAMFVFPPASLVMAALFLLLARNWQ